LAWGISTRAQVAKEDAGDKVVISTARAILTKLPSRLWSGAVRDFGDRFIVVVGAFNLMGPKHTRIRGLSAAGMVAITLPAGCLRGSQKFIGRKSTWERRFQHPMAMWQGFVRHRAGAFGASRRSPTSPAHEAAGSSRPARKSIWTVSLEVRRLQSLFSRRRWSPSPHFHEMRMWRTCWRTWPGITWALGRMAGENRCGLLLLSATNTARPRTDEQSPT